MNHLLNFRLCFLCFYSTCGISDPLVVTQSPYEVTVSEGDSVHLKCCWNETATKWTVNWLNDNASVYATHVGNSSINKSQCLVYQQRETCHCADLIITNTSSKHAGTITCKISIEIPSLKQSQGQGTRIIVRPTKTTTDGPKPPAGSTTAVPVHLVVQLTILIPLCLLCATLFYLWRRHHNQGKGPEEAARVIYQTQHCNSEELEIEDLEVDGHSTSSSRGSTQWRQVPVYESVDYFERVEDKGSK